MKVENRKIEELSPYKRNAKKHTERQIKNIAKSIDKFGFVQPLVVDCDGTIVIGHGRYEAAKRLKMPAVPCVCVDDLTDAQVRELRILDNRLNESPWDVGNLLSDINELDFSDFDINFTNILGRLGENGESKYTFADDIPQYHITGADPSLHEMVDTEKYDELMAGIGAAVEAGQISEEDENLLRWAATRHIKFRYGNIAEHYAHADRAMQELMERSALVIIDIDDAIKNGFTRLRKNIFDEYVPDCDIRGEEEAET